MNRRGLLRLAGASALALAARPVLRFTERTASAATLARPRFVLQIIPEGGVDAIYTTDPKTVREVAKGIDVPYGPGDIVNAGDTRLGPSFRALVPWMPRLAVVNAFRQNSANHSSGLIHTTRCKSNASLGVPSLLEILGGNRQGEAVGAVNIGATFSTTFSPKYLGEPGVSNANFGFDPGLFDHLDAADPADLVLASRALAREAATLGRARPASSAQTTTADNLRDSGELLARAATSPRFGPSDWTAGSTDLEAMEKTYRAGRDLQRALWLFENRMARCATVVFGRQDFDTHLWNPVVQPYMTSYLAFMLDRLFGELDRRIVDGRPLSQQTLVIVGSEIGRFPRLNTARGKDHFPQVSYLFYGPWFATGKTHGETGREMVAMPVSLATGRPELGGHVMRVDDIGTTLLHLDGLNPELFGYSGARLRYLLA